MADIAESVRLIQRDERGVVARWIAFTTALRSGILDDFSGEVIKSLGDGVLALFPSARQAVLAAASMHERANQLNVNVDPDLHIELRIGIHTTDVIESDFDVYGSGVNLASRVAGLARPRQTILTEEARSELVPELDPDVEDLGDCYLKHLDEPVRAYRLLHGQPPASGLLRAPDRDVRPSIAVVPFAGSNGMPPASGVGGVLAAELSLALTSSHVVHVIAPLSSLRLEGHVDRLGSAGVATHVVRGLIREITRGSLMVDLELVELSTATVVWHDQQRCKLLGLLADGSEHSGRWARDIVRALCQAELTRLRLAASLPTLPAYTVLLAAIMQMHRLAQRPFERAREALDYLIERHPRAADVRAWRAKCYLMEIVQRWTDTPEKSAGRAQDQVRRALDLEPGHPMATALEGYFSLLMDGDLRAAELRLRRLTLDHPNEPLGWLFLAKALTAVDGRAEESMRACERAMRLSPLDPMRYFFDAFAAAVHGAAGRHELALAYAQRSVRDNAVHLPGLVELMLAAVRAGRIARARRAARQYLALQPEASVQRYREVNANVAPACLDAEAQALLAAGIPLEPRPPALSPATTRI